MFTLFRKREPVESAALRQSAESWLQCGVKVLQDPRIQESIGEERAARLTRIAKGAGKLSVTNTVITRTRTKNGLFVAPIAAGLRADRRVGLRYRGGGRPMEWLEIGRIATESPIAQHVAYLEGDLDFLTLPSNGFSDDERAAIVIHGLVYADQRREGRVSSLPRETKTQTRARRAAEAYDVQFRVLDALHDGALSDLVAANTQSDAGKPDSDPLVRANTTSDELAEKINTSGVLSMPLRAAVRFQEYGYRPDGVTRVGLTLTKEMVDMGLFMTPPLTGNEP